MGKSSAPGDTKLEAQHRLREGHAGARRYAAIEMGRSGDPSFASALVGALNTEQDESVLVSIILSLGAIGGSDAKEALNTYRSESAKIRTALRKAQGRLAATRHEFQWKSGISLDNVYLEAPEGLERPVSLLLSKAGWPPLHTDAPGLLKVQMPVPASQISPPPRCCHAARLLINEQSGTDETAQARLLDALAASKPWAQWTESKLAADFPYRIRVEGGPTAKPALQRLIELCRSKLEPAGAVDSPSAYAAEIVVTFSTKGFRIYFRPCFFKDDRFFYRKRDVGASMNPVVAAALAQLAPPGLKGAIIDPVCGSGVPLIERALFDPEGQPLIGIDNSPVAVAAAKENLAAARLLKTSKIINTDARDETAWAECGFVIANLPYGLRVRTSTQELDALYVGILRRSEQFLTPNGRVVLATSYRTGLERALGATAKLRTLARYRLHTGGLFVQVAVLGRS